MYASSFPLYAVSGATLLALLEERSSSSAHLDGLYALCRLFLHVVRIPNDRLRSFHSLTVALEVLSIGPQNDV